MRRRWLIILAAIIALVISRLIWQQLQVAPIESNITTSRFAYHIDDLTLTILDPEGKQQLMVRSPKLVDEGEGKPSQLSEPIITSPGDNGTWQLTARMALIDRHNEYVTLIDDVVLLNLNQAKPIRVETTRAELDIRTKDLSSSKIVTITQPGMQVNGRGLSGNLEQANYVLHQDVHAKYDDRNTPNH